MAIDTDVSAVYAAEAQWSAMLDRGGVVDFFGSTLQVPIQRRFADIASVQRYVDRVLALPGIRERAGGAVRVRERKGVTSAHYECASATMAIPISAQWSGREAVILHELGHHLHRDETAPAHGVEYRRSMLRLVTVVHGDESALLLRTAYHGVGLS